MNVNFKRARRLMENIVLTESINPICQCLAKDRHLQVWKIQEILKNISNADGKGDQKRAIQQEYSWVVRRLMIATRNHANKNGYEYLPIAWRVVLTMFLQHHHIGGMAPISDALDLIEAKGILLPTPVATDTYEEIEKEEEIDLTAGLDLEEK